MTRRTPRPRGKASDISARQAHEGRQARVEPLSEAWRATSRTYAIGFAVSPAAGEALRGRAFNLGKPGYYLSHGKRGGLRRRKRKR